MDVPKHEPPTILVIDDNDVIAFAIQQAVPECRILHAVDGIAGLDIIRDTPRPIDLIVLDLVMPRMDGPTMCVRLREFARDVPILPFTSFPNERAMAPLRELGCLAPLLKPVDPMVLADTIRRALKTTPPPLAPGQGVLLWAQEQAARQEYVGRTTPTLQVIVCAATGIVQRGLQDLVERAGARVVARTSYPRNISHLLDTTSDLTAVVATCPELVELVPIAQHLRLSAVCVVSNLADGLTAMEWRDAAQIPFGIVVEHSDEQQSIVLMDRTLRCLAQGESVFPAALREPFAALRLSEQEQILLGADVRGLPASDVANRLSIDQTTLRQRRKRLREKLHVPDYQSLAVWAATWWQSNMSI